VHLREESREWWQVNKVAGERVEQADGGVAVPLQDEEALVGVGIRNSISKQKGEK